MRIGKSSLRTGAAIASFLASVGTVIGCGSSHSGGTAGNAGSGNGGSGAGDAVAVGGTGSGGAGTGGIGSGGTAEGLGGRGGIAGATGGGGSGGSGTGGADGGVAIGPGCVARTPGQWQLTSTVDEPPPLSSYTGKILWSGKALFVIGYNTTGGKYDPCLDTWQPFSAHSYSSLILTTDQGAYFWTASVGSTPLRFSFFDFATPAWRELAIDGYPTAADDPDAGGTAALVGGKLVRWGGKSQYATPYPLLTNTGAVYDPVTDRWQAMSTAGAPAERVVKGNYVAAAGRLFVWGGARTLPGTSGIPKDDPTAAAMTKAPGLVCPSWNPFECSYGDGALYDPATDSWKPVSQAGAPTARYGHFTAWTGTRVLVWGGAHYFASPSGGTSFEGILDGALYDPATDSWTPMAPSPLPSPYLSLYPRWSEGLLRLEPWATPEDPKYTYDPVTDRWAVPAPGPTVPARPDGPSQPNIVWTGSYWIAFGGYRLGTTPPNPCLDLPPLTTGCDPPGPEHISVSEAAVALPALPAP